MQHKTNEDSSDDFNCPCSAPICAGRHYASVLHPHTPVLPSAGVLRLHLWPCRIGHLHKFSGYSVEEEEPVSSHAIEKSAQPELLYTGLCQLPLKRCIFGFRYGRQNSPPFFKKLQVMNAFATT